MPIRRINHTARRRISQSDVNITLHGNTDGSTFFRAAMNLSDYGFPPDARIFIEAYRQTILMRFDFGLVSVPVEPSDAVLSDFQDSEHVLFRVKVTAVSGRPGVLLGEGDRIRPRAAGENPEHRIALLPPIPADLGEEVWRLDFEGGTTLLINRALPDWKQAIRSDVFRALVYPAAMRQILERIMLVERYFEADDPEDWRSQWLAFASGLPGSRGVPTARDDIGEWIENAVAAFARRFALRSRYVAESESGEARGTTAP